MASRSWTLENSQKDKFRFFQEQKSGWKKFLKKWQEGSGGLIALLSFSIPFGRSVHILGNGFPSLQNKPIHHRESAYVKCIHRVRMLWSPKGDHRGSLLNNNLSFSVNRQTPTLFNILLLSFSFIFLSSLNSQAPLRMA